MNRPHRHRHDRTHGSESGGTSRRGFMRGGAAAVTGLAITSAISRVAHSQPVAGTVTVGLVGCGGRGSGAARQALMADPNTRLVAVGDAFADKVNAAAENFTSDSKVADRVHLPANRRHAGFDAYLEVINSGADVILLATPPHFRPMHLRAAIEAGKHVFAEKPVAVDAPGIHHVLETTEMARQKKLYIVSGLNNRYSVRAREMMERIHEGAIGEVTAMEATRYHGGVWVRPRREGQTEMEYQMRNWYYFTWLSGDFNVEQFVHQMDALAWVMGDETPAKVHSNGGRAVRTGPEYGHIYDHFNSVFEWSNGVRAYAGTRHYDGVDNVFETIVHGTKGRADLGAMRITGEKAWQAEGEREDSHQLEQDAFFRSLHAGETINNGVYMSQSSMMAIAARMSAYTGRTLTWERAMGSKQELKPERYAWDAAPPAAEVAVPGKTEFV